MTTFARTTAAAAAAAAAAIPSYVVAVTLRLGARECSRLGVEGKELLP